MTPWQKTCARITLADLVNGSSWERSVEESGKPSWVVKSQREAGMLIMGQDGQAAGRGGQFGLEINREKTRAAEVKPGGGSPDFPGYASRWDRDLRGRSKSNLNVLPSAKAVAREREKQGPMGLAGNRLVCAQPRDRTFAAAQSKAASPAERTGWFWESRMSEIFMSGSTRGRAPSGPSYSTGSLTYQRRCGRPWPFLEPQSATAKAVLLLEMFATDARSRQDHFMGHFSNA